MGGFDSKDAMGGFDSKAPRAARHEDRVVVGARGFIVVATGAVAMDVQRVILRV